MPIAKHKGDNHTHDRSKRPNGCSTDQDVLPMLLEQVGLWPGLAALRLKEQIAVKPPPEVGLW
jgi:hypothetical protein